MASDLFDLSGKVALVTGATRGIGRAIAEGFAQHGAAVVVSSNEVDACESVAAELRGTGCNVVGIACDVSSRDELDRLVTRTLEMFSKIDILVCNAGVAPHMGPIASASDTDWDVTMTVNLRSVVTGQNIVVDGGTVIGDGN